LFGDRGNVLHALRLAERAYESSALRPCIANQPPLGQNYAPRKNAEGEQEKQNSLGDRTGLKDEINDFAANKKQEDGRKMHWFRGVLPPIIDQRGGAIREGIPSVNAFFANALTVVSMKQP
jgi:hypothetical protein